MKRKLIEVLIALSAGCLLLLTVSKCSENYYAEKLKDMDSGFERRLQ